MEQKAGLKFPGIPATQAIVFKKMIQKRDRTSQLLETIPGVGPSIAGDLRDLGIHQVKQLRDEDPRRLYDELCTLRRERIDPCVLYVFRCAVYYASHERHDEELLKWWNWKKRK